MSTYWIAGANFDSIDMYPTFIIRGYWELGWGRGLKPAYDACFDSIQKGDMVAIKRMLGQKSSNIEIRAIGKVLDKAEEGPEDSDWRIRRVYVDWIAKDMNRQVLSRGLFGTIDRKSVV